MHKKSGESNFKFDYSTSVPGAGIEPARTNVHWILSPARLPIPPPGQP